MADEMLPTFRGARHSNGCPNDDCEASDTYRRVMSTDEMERIFPRQSDLSITPVPPQATHLCDSCGYVFSGIDNRIADTDAQTDPTNDVDLTQYDWSPDGIVDKPLHDTAMELVEGAPESADRDEIRAAISQYIHGLDADDADRIMEQADRTFDQPVTSPAEFM